MAPGPGGGALAAKQGLARRVVNLVRASEHVVSETGFDVEKQEGNPELLQSCWEEAGKKPKRGLSGCSSSGSHLNDE